ncbi:hypothetical protein V1527DRAFT_478562 [Lipomyces starkeyi]
MDGIAQKRSKSRGTYGAFLALKGYPGTRKPTITINTYGEPITKMTGLGMATHRTRNSIVSPTGTVLEEQFDPRAALKGHVRSTQCDNLRLLYFVSYAMYNYITTPFIFTLSGFQVTELEPHRECEELRRVLEVTNPDGFPTHTKVQKFYFEANDFLLRRLDYETDVAAGGVGSCPLLFRL